MRPGPLLTLLPAAVEAAFFVAFLAWLTRTAGPRKTVIWTVLTATAALTIGLLLWRHQIPDAEWNRMVSPGSPSPPAAALSASASGSPAGS